MSVMDHFLATIKVILMGLMFVNFSTMNFALVTSKKEVVEGDNSGEAALVILSRQSPVG